MTPRSSRLRAFPLLWLPTLGGCALFQAPAAEAAVTPAPSPVAAATPTAPPTAPAAAAAPQAAVARAVPADASATAAAPPAQGPESAAGPGIDWRSPEFQRRFAESYLAESDFEPKVTASERDLLVEVAELLGAAGDDVRPAQDRAITLLQQRIDPSSSASLHFMLGSLLFQRERLPEAAAAYTTAVERHPSFRRAWKNLALVQMRSGDHVQARRALTRTVQLGGADALIYGLLGFALTQAEDHVGAESAYRLAAMLDPDTVDYRLGLARSFFKQRRFADAATLTGSLASAAPERGDLWLLQANAFVGMSEWKKAAENLELVDRLGQATAESLHLLGDLYVNDDLPDLAAGAYRRAIAKDQKGDAARALRAAKALAQRGAHGEARSLADAVEKAFAGRLDEPAKKDLLKLRARLAAADGASEEEIRVLEQIVALDPLDGEAILQLGQYHARRGEPDLAILQFERAANVPASEADAKVRHAQLLVGQGRYAEALPLLRRAQQVKPRENVQQFLDQIERLTQGRS